ncbi:class I SAM-dependent methyltransferase [Amycolatopsis suaedae]|uniref:class I SAM-dependent methyltransferase n=1 Tax=Amycolatopsis suaedae TaxID=2510978 RepID=UPI0013EF3591|nr:methyltransferase domain-containing protein [Amycolatopsis suaedae]
MTSFSADLFDSVADGYDEKVPFFATFARQLVAWAEPGPADSVLDLGTGRGAVSLAVAEARGAGEILAVDVSPRMVDSVAALGVAGLRARVMDAQALDLPDGSFDLVFSGFAFHILPDPAAALRETARVLRPGGRAVLSVPGPSEDGGWWAGYGEIVAEFTARLTGDVPPGMADEPWDEVAEQTGLRFTRTSTAEVRLPVDGPRAHWDWLLSHGNRWLYDALGEADRAEFAERVLASLRDAHPTGGRDVIAGAEFYELTKVR